MAGRLLALGARSVRTRSLIPCARVYSSEPHDHFKALIGKREVVGFGFNGQPSYVDRSDFPMPAIRWQETNSAVKTLRQKEQGDWRELSFEEKRALYRASFRQTFSEFQAPTGEWKSIVGCTLMLVAVSMGWYMFVTYLTSFNVPIPESYSEERKRAQLRRMLDLQTNPVTGIASKWDYENNDWKK